MRRGVGLSIGAVILSITLGVLVGLVIRAGMAERADQALHPSPNSSAAAPQVTTDSSRVGTVGAGPGITVSGTLGVGATIGADGVASAPPGPASGIVAAGSDARAPARTTVGGPTGEGPAASVTGAPVTASAPFTAPSTPKAPSATTAGTVTAAPSVATSTSATVATSPGSDIADQPCAALGAKSADPAGVTLFCQRHQGDGTLRWRAVADGGGCLNQTMTGTGADGRQYACRRGPDGLNHWAPIG